MSTNSELGNLIAYKDTQPEDGPFILVVGREQNETGTVVNKVKQYDFDTAPRCQFWVASYAMAAHAAEIGTQRFKGACRQLRTSPILYADCLPVCIPEETRSKWSIRDRVPEQQKIDHALSILAHSDYIKNVAIILFSGVRHPVFDASRDILAAGAHPGTIVVNGLHLYSNRTASKNKLIISPEATGKCGEIAQDFVQRHEQSDHPKAV